MDNYTSRVSKMLCATVVLLMLSCHHASGDVVFRQNILAEGSADATAVPAATTTDEGECFTSWKGYNDTYLQGVKEHFIIYNRTSFEDCVAICCRESDFECKSLSYSEVLEMCIIMNITRFHKDAQLKKTTIFRHYHRVYPGDNTTVAPETMNFTTPYLANETTPDTTADNQTEPATSPDVVTGTTSTIITATNQAVTEGETSAPKTTEFVSTERSTVTSASTGTTVKLTTATSVQTRITSTSGGDVATTGVVSTSPGTGLATDLATPPVAVTATTETVTILPDTTTTAKTTIKATASDRPAVAGSTLAIVGEETTSSNCPKDCKNGGKCEWVISSKDTKANINYASSECVCPKGFDGKHCEKRSAIAAGVPSYIIAVAVLGSIILILFLTVVIIYALYRSRTGKYRVREQRERWNKTTTARRAQSFNSMPTRSLVGSELSVPGSVNSTTTRSTATSV